MITRTNGGSFLLAVLLWIVVFFAALAGLDRSFVKEEESHTAPLLRLSASPLVVWAGKLIFNVVLIAMLLVALVPLYCVLMGYRIVLVGWFVVLLAAGGYALAATSTIVAAIIARAVGRGALFPVLALPLLLALLVFLIQGTTGAADGDAGLEKALREDCDLILLDLMLPGRGGLEILEALRERRCDTPVLIFTARDSVEDRVRGLDCGADDYLVKPFEPERLQISIHNSLERKRLIRENNFYRAELEKKIEDQSRKLETSQNILIQQANCIFICNPMIRIHSKYHKSGGK